MAESSPFNFNVSLPNTMPRNITPRDMQTMRQFALSQRIAHPFGMMRGGTGRLANGYHSGNFPMDMSTGVDPSTMDIGAMNTLLGQYGQHMPENPRTNAFLPMTGFFGSHPRLSAGIEGALFGAANTAPANTVGEGISNAIRGGLSGMAERGRVINQQFSQPFAQAQMVQNLQRGLYEHESEVVNNRLKGAEASYYEQKPDLEAARITEQANTALAKANATMANTQARLAEQEAHVDSTHAAAFRELGIDPYQRDGDGNLIQPSKEDWAKVNKLLQDRAMQRSAVGPNISAAAAGGRQDKSQDFTAAMDLVRGQLITNTTKANVKSDIFGTIAPSQEQIDAHNQQVMANAMRSMLQQNQGPMPTGVPPGSQPSLQQLLQQGGYGKPRASKSAPKAPTSSPFAMPAFFPSH